MKQKPSLVHDEPRRPHYVPAGRGRAYDMPSGPQNVILGNEETGSAYEIIEITAEPKTGPPLHIHRSFEETFYVLSGTLTVRLGTEVLRVEERGTLAIPAGVVHTWANKSDVPIRFLQFTVPGGMEGLTEAYSRAWRTSTAAELAALADRFGTTIVGPAI